MLAAAIFAGAGLHSPGQSTSLLNTNVTYTNVESYPSAAYYVSQLKKSGRTKEVIAMLIANGSVCDARGHLWNFGHAVISMEAVLPPPNYRICEICGLRQKQVTEWQDLNK